MAMAVLCLPLFAATAASEAAAARPWFDQALPRAERVSGLIAAMDPQEKIRQLVVGTPAIKRLGVPAYHWRNNILHGTVDNGLSTQFPQSVGMAASWDVPGLHGAARVMADEQRAKHNIKIAETGGDSVMDYGLDMWGPNINMFRDPRWGRGQETYGEDPILTKKLLVGFVTGLQNGAQTANALGETIYQTLATCKHFVGYSVDEMPPRLSFDPNVTQTDLYQYFFPAWEACAKTAVSVMCAYNGINGYPMCMSPMINDVLRDEFNFTARPENYVVTDSGALDFMVSRFHRFNDTGEDAAVAAMHAGVDLNSGDVFGKLSLALTDGRVKIDEIDTALTRLFHARMSLGLFDNASNIAYSGLGADDIFSGPHKKAALAMSQRSLLLLKNENEMLPLSPSKVKTIAVVGWGANDTYAPLANYMGCGFGSWSPRLANCSIVTPLMGITQGFPDAKVTFSHGCDVESNDTSGFAAAVAAAKAADVVVFVGGNRNCEGGQGHGGHTCANKSACPTHCESEGHDRPDLEMPGVQTALLKELHAANPNVVLAVLTGGPISFQWEAKILPAIVTIWYGGQMMGTALADVLTGVVSPSGRSPFTWPTGLEQVPPELEMSPSTPPGRTYRYLEGTPLYAFGFGLSYGKVSYSKAAVSPATAKAECAPSSSGTDCGSVTVCVEVTNVKAATHATEEVVQVYAAPGASVKGASLPKSLLLGFARTGLLQPGDSETVCIPVDMADLRLMGEGEKSFTLLSGDCAYTGAVPPHLDC